MGASFLSLFFGTVIMGWVGSFYDQMGNAMFWSIDAAIAFAGAVLILLLHRPLEAALSPTASEPANP